MFKYIILIALMLSSCASTSTHKVRSPILTTDPDPLCRFKEEPTSIELLDRILSNSMFAKHTIVVPYRIKKPIILEIDSFKVCSLNDSEETCFFYDVFCD